MALCVPFKLFFVLQYLIFFSFPFLLSLTLFFISFSLQPFSSLHSLSTPILHFLRSNPILYLFLSPTLFLSPSFSNSILYILLSLISLTLFFISFSLQPYSKSPSLSNPILHLLLSLTPVFISFSLQP